MLRHTPIPYRLSAEARVCGMSPGQAPAPGPREMPPIEPQQVEHPAEFATPQQGVDTRVQAVSDVQDQLLASNFQREIGEFLNRYNNIPSRFAGQPELMRAEMTQEIQKANRELLMRHMQSGGRYPLYVLHPAPDGIVAVMQTPRGPHIMRFPGAPFPGPVGPMPVPGMPNHPGIAPGYPPQNVLSGRLEYPPRVAGPDYNTFIRGMYQARNPEKMTPERRELWKQSIIASMEMTGCRAPQNFDAMIAGKEPIIVGGSREKNLLLVIGTLRLVAVAIGYAKILKAGEQPPVDIDAAIKNLNDNPNAPVQMTLERDASKKEITKLTMEVKKGAKIKNEDLVKELEKQGLKKDKEFKEADGKIVFDKPTEDTVRKAITAVESLTPKGAAEGNKPPKSTEKPGENRDQTRDRLLKETTAALQTYEGEPPLQTTTGSIAGARNAINAELTFLKSIPQAQDAAVDARRHILGEKLNDLQNHENLLKAKDLRAKSDASRRNYDVLVDAATKPGAKPNADVLKQALAEMIKANEVEKEHLRMVSNSPILRAVRGTDPKEFTGDGGINERFRNLEGAIKAYNVLLNNEPFGDIRKRRGEQIVENAKSDADAGNDFKRIQDKDVKEGIWRFRSMFGNESRVAIIDGKWKCRDGSSGNWILAEEYNYPDNSGKKRFNTTKDKLAALNRNEF
ncbi:MAG: hypothetical protein G01um101425_179 [Candidatus Peregrinibacteria bacterium Gr01-1014_25]|nr:MAG: hypothetical protein G01um101425_179 [Candidatus Peregrinibacteria bacterium Gr01-1014_25]